MTCFQANAIGVALVDVAFSWKQVSLSVHQVIFEFTNISSIS
jgi:hypothetical protein